MKTVSEIKKQCYPSGNLRMEKSYKNGKLDGIIKVYYENGELGAERIYKNGKLQSIHIYKNGKIIEHKTYNWK